MTTIARHWQAPEYPGSVSEALDAVEEAYEYLVAYVSQDRHSLDDSIALEQIERVQRGLEVAAQALLHRAKQQEDGAAALFETTQAEARNAQSALALFLSDGNPSPEAVNALIALPCLQNSLTTLLFFEQLDLI